MSLPTEFQLAGHKIDKKFIMSGVRYFIVGFSTFALDYFLNWLLIIIIGMNYLLVGYIVAPITLSFNFLSHKYWSFADAGSDKSKTGPQVARYLVLIAFNAFANMVLMYLFYGRLGLPLLEARAICTILGVIWTFPILRFWVYKK